MNEVLSLKPRTRVTWSKEEKVEWIRLFEQSGQTALQFCRDNDLSPASLCFWRQEFGEAAEFEGSLVEVPREVASAAIDAVQAPTITPANPISAPPALSTTATAAVALQLPSGMRLEIPVGLDMAWFGQMLQAIVNAKA